MIPHFRLPAGAPRIRQERFRRPLGGLALLGLALFMGFIGFAVAATDRADSGRRLLGELNCTACHRASPRQLEWVSAKAGPRLPGLGARVGPDWLRRFLESPSTVMPGATMPGVLGVLPEAERSAAADDLTHYLLSADATGFRRTAPDRAAVARGEALYHRVGCAACHAPIGRGPVPADSVALPAMVEKWSLEGLTRFLLDPLATRPSGRMPGMNLGEREARDIAHFLLQDTKVPFPLELAEYGGPIRSLEDLDSAELLQTSPAEAFGLESLPADRRRAVRISGWLQIPVPGEYAFHLKAAGACRLSIDGEWVLGANSWDIEKVDEQTKVRLDAGVYPIAADFVRRGPDAPSLRLEWEGPGAPRGPIPVSRLSHTRTPGREEAAFAADAAKATRGRRLYERLNCAACHEGKGPDGAAPGLGALRPERGCLAGRPGGAAPDFALDAGRREALQEALRQLSREDLEAPTTRERIRATLARFRCDACHARDGVGGPAPDRDALFTSNGDDLGDEGRLPPRLDGVGDKLQAAWLERVLAEGLAVRPYLNTRMPRFGSANLGSLGAWLAEADRRPQPIRPDAAPMAELVNAGRRLVGTDGLSCIACHRFNRQPAHALQIIDLATVTNRLNEDWFRRFLLDPNRFHPGTRMPAFWPEGKSPLTDLLGGRAERQFAAIWAYLAEGALAKFPEGLSRQSLEIIVGGEPVVYRGKLWEAGFRAVAVGYPGQVSAAFDAEEMRLSLLWRGRFLNAGPHWQVAGMGRIRPLGGDVVVFPHGSPLAVLDSPGAAWPAGAAKVLGMKFGGYQLDRMKRPAFLYSYGGLKVTDFLEPEGPPERPALRRTLSFTGPTPAGLHLRLAAGAVTPLEGGLWRVDGHLAIKPLPPAVAFVRGAGEHRELLLPVSTAGGESKMEVEYAW